MFDASDPVVKHVGEREYTAVFRFIAEGCPFFRKFLQYCVAPLGQNP